MTAATLNKLLELVEINPTLNHAFIYKVIQNNKPHYAVAHILGELGKERGQYRRKVSEFNYKMKKACSKINHLEKENERLRGLISANET